MSRLVGYILAGLISCGLGHLSAMELGGNFWNLGWHNPGDCFQNLRQVRGENPWNPQFLKEIAVYRSLRFMDWDHTNNSQRDRWSQRNPATNLVQNPAAYEWMIDLCNRTKADMWVTLPHRAVTHNLVNEPADYALRLCILVKTGVDMREVDLTTLLHKFGEMRREDFIAAGGAAACEPLNPKLKLYVEYSNETWNGGFKQAHYCCDEGLAAGLDTNRWTAGFKFHAWAAIRVFRAADLVFGKDSSRVVKVLATQSANPWIAERHVEVVRDSKHNPWGTRASAMATAPYFGHSVAGDAPDVSEQLHAGIQSSAQQSARHKKIADAAGLKLIAYEGGQHVTKAARKINLDPAMYGLYMEYLNEMSKYFSHFCHYAHVGRAGDGGAWGAIEHTGQPLEQAHKYRALEQWSAKNH